MDSLAGYRTAVGIYQRRLVSRALPNRRNSTQCLLFVCWSFRALNFSCNSEPAREDFPLENAYELLEVSETSSLAEIKASFHRLAKQTHPDLSNSRNDFAASRRFVQILAAYEVPFETETVEFNQKNIIN